MDKDVQTQVISSDLKAITVKELQDLIKAINEDLDKEQKLLTGGKKGDLVERLTLFFTTGLEDKKKDMLSLTVDTVNRVARKKLNWKYQDNQIITARSSALSRASVARTVTDNRNQIHFRINPFFKVVTKLTSTKFCPASTNRHSITFQFTLTEDNRHTLAGGNASDDRPAFQIRFCSAAYSSDDNIPTDGLPVEFPNICELKVNENVIAGTLLRGIKGKPGTVNPPDLTILTRKSANNTVELVYIQTEKQYATSIYIMERRSVQDLMKEMKEKRFLPKEDVLEKIRATQEDNDIIMESETISTRCPLAFTRIITPCRSIHCNHLQCFDTVTYLTMNEQTPTWACPVCYKKISNWEDLVVDGYFLEMLKNTPKHIESVKVEPTGLITIIDEHPELYNESEEEEEDEEELLRAKKSEPPEEVTILDDDDDDNNNEQNGNDSNNDNNVNGNVNGNANNDEDDDDDEDEDEDDDSNDNDKANDGNDDDDDDDDGDDDYVDDDDDQDIVLQPQQKRPNKSNSNNKRPIPDTTDSTPSKKQKSSFIDLTFSSDDE